MWLSLALMMRNFGRSTERKIEGGMGVEDKDRIKG